jgi:hypothetical protein
MSETNPNHGNSFPPYSPKRFPAIIATSLIFMVVGLFVFLLTTELPTAWKNCSFGFPTAELPKLLQLTLNTAFDRAVLNFREVFVFEPTFKLAAAACIWSGLRKGKPQLLVPAIAWLLVALPLVVLLTSISIMGELIVLSNVFVLFVGLVVSIFCSYFARMFW